MALAIAVSLFFSVTALITLFGYRRYVRPGRVYENLKPSDPLGPPASVPANRRYYAVIQLAEKVARRVPPPPAKASRYQQMLLAAGYRQQNAVSILWGLKMMLAAGLVLVSVGLQVRLSRPAQRMLCLFGAVAIGFVLPDFILSKTVKSRQRRLRTGLPDALDLMVVCAEGGLALDRSLRVVTQHLGVSHPELSDEIGLVRAEITAGIRRKEALQNLATRTAEPEVRKFVAVLVQADRFGTSMGDALRTHAEYLRVRRRQEAEERASKVGVKLIFPIFFFMLPTILLVSVGPAVLQLAKHLGPALTGAK